MPVLPQNAKITLIEAIKAQGYDDFAASLGVLLESLVEMDRSPSP